MSEEDFKKMQENLEQEKGRVLESEENALDFLVKAGVATPDGHLAPQYQ